MANENNQASDLESLAQKAQAGDTQAFGKLFDSLTKSLYRFVHSKTRCHADTEDIVAETWRIFWVNLPAYKPKNVKGYLFQIAYTKTIDFFRQHQNTNLLKDTDIADTKQNIEKNVIKKSQKTKLRQAIAQLTSPYQEVIWLRFIEELSVKETATALNKNLINIRVIQHRALKKLKKIINE